MGATSRLTGTLAIGAGEVGNEQIDANSPIDSDKLQHLHKAGSGFGLAIGGTVAAHEAIVYVCEAATATIRGFHALLNSKNTTGTASFDVKKNGTTVLSSTVDFTTSDASGSIKDGTLSSSALVAGDILSLALTVASSPDGTGPFAWVEVDENAG